MELEFNLFNLLPVALWVDAVVIASESFLESAIVNPIATAEHNETRMSMSAEKNKVIRMRSASTSTTQVHRPERCPGVRKGDVSAVVKWRSFVQIH